MNRRLWSKQRLKPGQTHHNGINQHDVCEALQGLHQDPQQLLDVLIRG